MMSRREKQLSRLTSSPVSTVSEDTDLDARIWVAIGAFGAVFGGLTRAMSALSTDAMNDYRDSSRALMYAQFCFQEIDYVRQHGRRMPRTWNPSAPLSEIRANHRRWREDVLGWMAEAKKP